MDKQFSDEAETCTECLEQGFTLERGTISNPGKFEAEPLSTYHAYHVMLNGCADGDDGADFRVGNVICHEREDGFVIGETYDSEEDAIAAWNEGAPYS